MPARDDFNPQDLTAEQLRAARALLGWRAQDLADKAGVHVVTVRRAEIKQFVMSPQNAEKVVKTLQKSGIIFIPAVGGGVGVRLKR